MLTDLTQVLSALNIKGVTPGRTIKPTTEQVTSHAAVAEKLRTFGGDGWICTADRVTRKANYAYSENDPILSAELCDGDVSLRVLYDGRCWHVTTLREETDEHSIIVEQSHIALDGTSLVYHTAWAPHPNASGLLQYQSAVSRLFFIS